MSLTTFIRIWTLYRIGNMHIAIVTVQICGLCFKNNLGYVCVFWVSKFKNAVRIRVLSLQPLGFTYSCQSPIVCLYCWVATDIECWYWYGDGDNYHMQIMKNWSKWPLYVRQASSVLDIAMCWYFVRDARPGVRGWTDISHWEIYCFAIYRIVGIYVLKPSLPWPLLDAFGNEKKERLPLITKKKKKKSHC